MGVFSSKTYLLLLGFILVVAGAALAFSSAGAASQASFDSPSALSNSTIDMFFGVIIVIAGMMLMLMWYLSLSRKTRQYIYY